MKGGRTAPRKAAAREMLEQDEATSMKGGRTAPRKFGDTAQPLGNTQNFNEGGADCPPKGRAAIQLPAPPLLQ